MGENNDVASFHPTEFKAVTSTQSVFEKPLQIANMSEERPAGLRQTVNESSSGGSPVTKDIMSDVKNQMMQSNQPSANGDKYDEGNIGLLSSNLGGVGVSSTPGSGLTFDLPDVSTSLAASVNLWSAPPSDETGLMHGFQAMNNNGLSLQNYGVNNNNSMLNSTPVAIQPGTIGSNIPSASHMSAVNPVMPMSMNGFVNQHHRRAITGSQNGFPFGIHKSGNGRMPWNAQQSMQWTGGQSVSPWVAALQQQKQNRPVPNMQMNHTYRHKPQVHHQGAPGNAFTSYSRYRNRPTNPGSGMLSGNGSYDQFYLGRESQDNMASYQEPRQSTPDPMRLDSLQTQIMDIMRQSHFEGQDQQHKASRGQYGMEEHNLLDDNNIDSGFSMAGLNRMDRPERYSRKVFVGGLPPDIDEEEITSAFRRFGPLVVDWPHKAESKSYFPPKGYCFLLFQEELSVQALIDTCYEDDNKLYWFVSSPTMKDKPVQIRSWNLSDSDFVMDGSQPIDPRKTIFVGGVPRPLRAVELAMIMDRLYGGVCYAGIDTDPELKYPKGAGRVAFSNQQSYIAAISARFVQLQQGDIDKRVEVKPYVLDDQLCDECQGARCGGKFAPFFCANITCLQYYCEHCWGQVHARPGREFHKPLVKEGADRPRAVPFRWC